MDLSFLYKTRGKTENQEKKHFCPDCGSSFNRPYRLAQHLLLHNNIRAYECEEENCTKSYSSKSHLDRHRNSVHLKPNRDVVYSCPSCMKVYVNRQNLKRHMNNHHVLKSSFTCDVCKMDLNKKHQLTGHMYQHTGIKSFSCELCNEELVTLYDKKRHMRYHKKYNCVDCNMEFNHWSKYQKHKKVDHEKTEFICNECDRSFKQRGHIVRHLKIHAARAINKTYPCPYENCERVYSTNSNMKQHIMINHMKMSHKCWICNAQLSTKAKLNYHVQIHYRPEIIISQPKTKTTGRKERKDKGIAKSSTALKLAGLKTDSKIKESNASNEQQTAKQPEVENISQVAEHNTEAQALKLIEPQHELQVQEQDLEKEQKTDGEIIVRSLISTLIETPVS